MIHLLKRRWSAIALMMVSMSLLAACGGAPPVTSWPGMTVDGSTAYVASSDQILAIDTSPDTPDTGRQKWIFKPGSSGIAFQSQPALSDDRKVLYLGTDSITGNSGAVIALDLTVKNITVTWAYPMTNTDFSPGNIYGGIVLANGKLFFADGLGQLFALDANTGRMAWQQPFNPNTGARIWSTPAVNDKLVFVASQDHHVYAVDQSTGDLAWKFPVAEAPQVGTFSGSPAVYSDTLYVGSFDSNLYALDLTGKLKWTFKADGRLWDPPAEVDGILYFGDLNGDVYALDAATGLAKWSQPAKVEGGVRATPLIADGKIYIGTDQFKLYALDTSGHFYWQNPFAGKDGEMFVVTPAITGTTLIALPNLAGSTPTRLYGLNADTGAQLWSFPAPTQ